MCYIHAQGPAVERSQTRLIQMATHVGAIRVLYVWPLLDLRDELDSSISEVGEYSITDPCECKVRKQIVGTDHRLGTHKTSSQQPR